MKERIVLALKRLGTFLAKPFKIPLIRTIITGGIGGAMMAVLLPIETTILLSSILLFHELAHYLTALGVEAKPELPFFIPLGIVMIGVTRVRELRVRHVPLVALSGPIVGTFLSIFALSLGLVLKSPRLVLGSSCSLMFEVYGGTFGSDGSKARKAHHQMAI